ncbi:MAG: HNH endonuclease domain-containing protein [Janthinobacterium lividum]
MHLPEDDRLDIANLNAVFGNTTNSYKFYWLLAILESLEASQDNRIPLRELSLRMVAGVWYPLDYFKLSFGKQDGFRPIADTISQYLTVDNRPSAPGLFTQLKQALSSGELEQLYEEVEKLLRWVPYRFIRPFFASELQGVERKVDQRIVELAATSTRAPYRFIADDIEVHEAWADYLRRHSHILRGFTYWHLVRFLQKHNPYVIGLSEKLLKPIERAGLRNAKKFWKEFIVAEPGQICIYSGELLTSTNISLDHFLPWSYVAHDQLWNIIPTIKRVNSAKNDRLPSFELYFDAYSKLQFEAFQYHVSCGNEKLLEDYHILFAQDLKSLQQQPLNWFRERLKRQVLPQLQTAQNLGFSYPFEYRHPIRKSY